MPHPVTTGTHLALFADDTCIYAAEKHERRVVCKLQRCLTAASFWNERWNIKVDEGKIQTIYFSRRLKVREEVLRLNGRNIVFVSNVTYVGVTCDRRTTWKHHIEGR
jgi:hypothetical protein